MNLTAANDSNSIELYLDLYWKLKFSAEIWCLIVAPLVIILNLLLLYVIYLVGNQRLQCTQRFITAMTVSDLIFAIVMLFWGLYRENCHFQGCESYFYLISRSFQSFSTLFLLFLNINKLIYFLVPLKYWRYSNTKTVTAEIAFSVIVSLVFSISFETDIISVVSLESRLFTLTVIFHLTPTVTNLIISYRTLKIATKLQTRNNSRKSINQYKAKLKPRTVIFAYLSSMWAIFTFVPYRFLACLAFIFEKLSQPYLSPGVIRDIWLIMMIGSLVLFFLMPIGLLGNPIITVITHREYRISIQKIITSMSCHALKPRRATTLSLRSLESINGM